MSSGSSSGYVLTMSLSPYNDNSNATAPTAKQVANSAWAHAAAQNALTDPLMECLAVLAGQYGRRTTATALAAGLPLKSGELVAPEVFIRAAARAGFSARLVRISLADILARGNLPCILVLADGHACILREKTDEGLGVIAPETPDAPVLMTEEALSALYTGYVFFVRPRAHIDSRAGTADDVSDRHWFWSAIWRYRKIYAEVMIAAVLVNLLALASPLFTMNVYDRVVPNGTFSTLWVLAGGVLLAYIFDFLLKNLRAHFVDAAGRRADNIIAARIFEKLLAMKMTSRPPSIGVHAANLREFETLRDFFTSATAVALIDLPFILFFLAVIWLIAGPVVFIPAVLVPVVIVAGIALQRPLDKIVKESMRESAYKSALIYEVLSGLETLKTQVAEGHMQRKWEELNEKTSETHVRTRALTNLGLNIAGLAAGLSSIGMVVYGTYLITAGEMTMGALIAAVILSGRVMAPLTSIANLLIRFSQSRESLSRLDVLMASPVEREAEQSFISMPLVHGRIDFRNVLFRYPQQKTPALSDVSFSLRAGEHVGIIGAVGSGKTTIERLILNLYQPESGSVQIDGVDVRQIDPSDLRRQIGVVQQSSSLFFGTVRENITLGRSGVPDEVVLRVASISGVMDFLRESEAGLDTMVGERGENLSGGQRQAIAIARALLEDPPVLLLDEPTAALDPSSERKLSQRLSELGRNKTIVLVTHKSALLSLVDRIIVMDRGKILADGPRDEVLSKLQGKDTKVAANGDMS